MTNYMAKKSKKRIFYVYVDGDEVEAAYNSEADVKEALCDGDIVYRVVAVKKYKLVNEEIKLIEIT